MATTQGNVCAAQEVPVTTSPLQEGGTVRDGPHGLDPDEIWVITPLEPGSAHTGMGVYLPLASPRGAIINAYKTL